jgi:7-carboxy-7-deazaguanine synthase
VVDGLHAAGHLVAVETQGAACPEWLERVDQLVVSPKPPSSGMFGKAVVDFPLFARETWRRRAEVRQLVSARTNDEDGWRDLPLERRDVSPPRITSPPALKVVVFDATDYRWALEMHLEHWPIDQPLYLSVGTDRPLADESLAETRARICERLAWLIERVAAYGGPVPLRVAPQLHVLAFGHARGV